MRLFADFRKTKPEPEPEPEIKKDSALLPVGWYLGRIEKVSEKASSLTTGRYIQLEIRVGVDMKTQFLFFSLRDNALWRLKQFLWRIYGIKPQGTVELNTDCWIGTMISIKIDVEQYGGGIRNHVSNFKHPNINIEDFEDD